MFGGEYRRANQPRRVVELVRSNKHVPRSGMVPSTAILIKELIASPIQRYARTPANQLPIRNLAH